MNLRKTISANTPKRKREVSATKVTKADFSSPSHSPVGQILYLQQTLGNQAVQRLLESSTIQAKLTICQPSDIYEQEADRVAEQVMRIPETSAQRQSKAEAEEEVRTQRQATAHDAPISEAPPIVHDVLSAPGQPLDTQTRAFFEPQFGYDFSRVRVHTDAKAAKSAESVNARAYTVGPDILFGAGRHNPGTQEGQRLLGHELVHVVQQRGLSEGGTSRGLLQRDGKTDVSHLTEKPTPEEYLKRYYNWFGLNLREEKLASDLYLLAWQSPSHYNFVLEVFKLLDKDNQIEVAQAFFEQLRSDSFIEDMALAPEGRSFLTAIVLYLPKGNRQRERVEKIVLAGPQAEREKEREESIEALKKKGKTADITFYTSFPGMDTAEAILEYIAKGREKRKVTDAAFPMESFEIIGVYLDEMAKQSGATDYIRELHLMGHGTENNFGFGKYYYSSEYLRDNFGTGLHAKHMAGGATIYMEGCDIAKGEAGLKYLREVGRIFFGDKKSGYIKGNTCKVIGIGEITECGPRTLRWPSDFK